MSDAPQQIDLASTDGVAAAFLEHAITPAALKGITEEELEAVYQELCDRVDAEEYSAAVDLAVFLVTHQPWDRRFHFAFGVCLQQLGDFESAARHFSQAYIMDATDAGCAYRLGECLEILRHFDEAREAFKAARDLSFLEGGSAEIRDAAQARLDVINSCP